MSYLIRIYVHDSPKFLWAHYNLHGDHLPICNCPNCESITGSKLLAAFWCMAFSSLQAVHRPGGFFNLNKETRVRSINLADLRGWIPWIRRRWLDGFPIGWNMMRYVEIWWDDQMLQLKLIFCLIWQPRTNMGACSILFGDSTVKNL